jgi:multicomponent Na+:H+ antiporter subunit G
MNDLIAALLIIAGSFFMLVAALGVVRLPDVFMRMHAITKASSLALLLISAGLAVAVPGLRILVGSLTLMVFIFLTTPVASHMIAKAAALLREPMAQGSKINEYETTEEVPGEE